MQFDVNFRGNFAFNCDCMQFMKSLPDNAFDLACCDPPYGIGIDGQNERYDYKNPKRSRKYHKKEFWDNSIPNLRYFEELERVSKNQIIWGGELLCRAFKARAQRVDCLG